MVGNAAKVIHLDRNDRNHTTSTKDVDMYASLTETQADQLLEMTHANASWDGLLRYDTQNVSNKDAFVEFITDFEEAFQRKPGSADKIEQRLDGQMNENNVIHDGSNITIYLQY